MEAGGREGKEVWGSDGNTCFFLMFTSGHLRESNSYDVCSFLCIAINNFFYIDLQIICEVSWNFQLISVDFASLNP